jgi:hypothetical protein
MRLIVLYPQQIDQAPGQRAHRCLSAVQLRTNRRPGPPRLLMQEVRHTLRRAHGPLIVALFAAHTLHAQTLARFAPIGENGADDVFRF